MNLNPLASGNKTVSAGLLGTLLGFLAGLNMIWRFSDTYSWWPMMMDTGALLNLTLGATGLGHKAWKVWVAWKNRHPELKAILEGDEKKPGDG